MENKTWKPNSELEVLAYKLYTIWNERSRKMFPNYRHPKIKEGDPRKTTTFKTCYKTVRETEGLLEEKDFDLYVRAQLDIISHLSGNQPLLTPNCLAGDKAWKRWKLWKSKFDKASKKPIEKFEISQSGVIKAIHGIVETKKFIVKNIGEKPSLEDYSSCKKLFFNWANFGKISPYYLAISPYVQKIFTEEDFSKLNFDPKFYQNCINDEVRKKFTELFAYELT